MIPTIEQILADLMDGSITREKALAWIEAHLKLAEESAMESLRDHFAGQALVGCFNFWAQVKNIGASIGDPDQAAITRLAYEYADAMIEARAK
jgi:hypothetical protein